MAKKKEKSGSIRIDPDVLSEAKLYCASKGLFINKWVTNILQRELEKQKSKTSELIKP
jgi:hypothetical protein